MQNNSVQLLQKASFAFQQKNFAQAIEICHQILNISPYHKDAFHIRALCYASTNQTMEAEQSFREAKKNCKTIDINLLSNFANFLNQNGKLEESLLYYKKCIEVNKNNEFFWRCSAIIYNKLANYSKAIIFIEEAIRLNSSNYQSFNIQGSILKNIAEYIEAIEAFKKGLELSKGNPELLFNLSLCYRLDGRFNEAFDIVKGLVNKIPNNPELEFQFGCLYYDLANFELSERHLRKAISINPEYTLAHETLSKLIWENQDQTEGFINSYHEYIRCHARASEPMLCSMAQQYILIGEYQQAETTLKNALQSHQGSVDLLYALSSVYSRSKDNILEAKKILERILSQQPNHLRAILDLSVILIKQEQHKLAEEYLNSALSLDSNNAEVWAYLGICWKKTDGNKFNWLNDYDKLIHHGEFNVKSIGYTHEEFKQELLEELFKLHNSNRSPLDQSVRNGSQTMGNIFRKQPLIFKKLEQLLTEQFEIFRSRLTVDNKHPFLSKIEKPIYFNGAWSVLLQKEGFHSNHIHPKGWISGPAYISIPSHFNENDPDREGWIKFGETSLGLQDDKPDLEICPRENTCIFFPSYMWHGTNPVSKDAQRMTISYDVSPKVRS